jgi:hypothetical protein
VQLLQGVLGMNRNNKTPNVFGLSEVRIAVPKEEISYTVQTAHFDLDTFVLTTRLDPSVNSWMKRLVASVGSLTYNDTFCSELTVEANDNRILRMTCFPAAYDTVLDHVKYRAFSGSTVEFMGKTYHAQ